MIFFDKQTSVLLFFLYLCVFSLLPYKIRLLPYKTCLLAYKARLLAYKIFAPFDEGGLLSADGGKCVG